MTAQGQRGTNQEEGKALPDRALRPNETAPDHSWPGAVTGGVEGSRNDRLPDVTRCHASAAIGANIDCQGIWQEGSRERARVGAAEARDEHARRGGATGSRAPHRHCRGAQNTQEIRLTRPKPLDSCGRLTLADRPAAQRSAGAAADGARAITVAESDQIEPVTSEDVRDHVEQRTGIRPSPSSVQRWRTTGVGGVVLSGVRVGGRWYTSAAAIDQFLQQLQDRGALA